MYDPKPPSSLRLDVPEGLDEVIMKAIKKKKDKRWESEAVMLTKLKEGISKKI